MSAFEGMIAKNYLKYGLLETKFGLTEVWFVRILMHKIKGKCIDIRQFNKKYNGDTEWFEPSDNGIVFQINLIDKIIDAVWKMLRKHKEK